MKSAPKRKLTRSERKQIEAIIQQAKGDGKPHTVQDSIPFRNIYPDGLCRLDGKIYSKTIEYEDVNYRLAGPDDQRDIFERLCDFYNGYDPSIGVQMTLCSRPEAAQTDRFGMAAHGDTLDDLRREAAGILQKQYEKGSNGYVKSKYEVPYDYYICTVTLENFNLSHVPVYIMDESTLSMYAVYMSTLGNRSDLFPDSDYVDKYITNPPEEYEVPAEYLSDERFATLIAEAEKYIGYPYVWGGSSPATSFDCSGFVSYVLSNSGLCNTGRLGAQGLYNICTPVSTPQPGDPVSFVGTYDTAGISHVGFYVGKDEAGNQMFLHCGDVRPDRTKVEVDERRIDEGTTPQG